MLGKTIFIVRCCPRDNEIELMNVYACMVAVTSATCIDHCRRRKRAGAAAAAGVVVWGCGFDS